MSYHQFTDEELADLLRNGDHKAYTVIFERFYGLLFIHACKMLPAEDDAKDVVQELFEILWTRRESLFFEHSLSAYLYAGIRNRIINRMAHQQVKDKYINSLRDFMDCDSYRSDYQVREREMINIIEKEISALPAKMREVFELSRKEYLSYKQIALKLQLSEQTVRTHVKKALRILRPKLTIIILLCLFSVACFAQQKMHILVITGGHGFKQKPFYQMFDSLGKGISYDKLEQPAANELIASLAVDKYDALVFYDMYNSITPAQKQAYIQLLKKGKAMIFLHHALVSYQDWDEFQEIIGGKYYEKATLVNGDTIKSSYQHDVIIPVKIADRKHPVTRGIKDFEIYDEVYGNFGTQPRIRPLLSTVHPGSSRYIAWINPYAQTEVLFIQLGHGPEAFGNPNYRKLLFQGIKWSVLRHRKNN